MNLLDKIHQINLDDVQNFEGWYFGGPNSTLAISANMMIEPLDPNEIGNLGLINRHNIQLRQHSVIFHNMFKNSVSSSSYTYFFPDKKIYTYTDVFTRREIIGGPMLLNLIYAVIKPQIVVDHCTPEMRIEALTLSDCDNNICTFLTKQQSNFLEIDHLMGDDVTYDPHHFATLVFDELVKTTTLIS